MDFLNKTSEVSFSLNLHVNFIVYYSDCVVDFHLYFECVYSDLERQICTFWGYFLIKV